MLLTLPSEVIYEILGNLSRDPAALRSSSLTCKALSLPSQSFFFSRVELHMHTPIVERKKNSTPFESMTISKESNLLSILKAKPALIPYIHEVFLFDIFPEDPELDHCIVMDPSAPNEDAVRVLSLLTYTQRLVLPAHSTRSWKHLDPRVEDAILNAFQLPHITSVEVNAMTAFPVPLFEGCTRELKHISISTYPNQGLSFGLAPLERGLDPIYLESLCISTSTPNLRQFMDWVGNSRFNLTRLRKLVVRALGDEHKADQPLVWELVSKCASTLKELEFFAYLPYSCTDIKADDVLSLYDTVNLSQLSSLKKLTIRYWLFDLSDSARHLTLLARLLRSMSNALNLEELVLHFAVLRSRTPYDPTGPTSWRVIDDAIMECGPPRLDKVVVQFDGVPDSSRYGAVEVVEAGLSKVNACHILNVHSSPVFGPFFR